jgi:pheromone shutdown-related protein TraB
MLNQVEKVRIGGKSVFLVGTAHVSPESVKLVRETIEKEKPDSVAVELCEQRYKVLKEGSKWAETKMADVLKEGKAHLFLANLILSNFQRKIGEELGVKPGAEMLEAVKVAEKKKIPVELVDRDIQITFKRALAKMGWWEKSRVSFSLFVDMFGGSVDEEVIEQLKGKDVMTEVIEELAKEAPSVKAVLIDERDIYIANKILKAPGKKVVAVVGAGHVAGLKKRLKQKTRNLKSLERAPKKKNGVRHLKWAVPVLFAVLVGYGLLTKGAGVTASMLLWWFLINGSLSAIGTALAFGHPASVLAAFLAAPLTSLNPLVAAGWVAGWVQARVKNPRVRDFEGLNKLNGFRDYWKNDVTRVLLVVIFANLGSTIGTVVALPYLLSLL